MIILRANGSLGTQNCSSVALFW